MNLRREIWKEVELRSITNRITKGATPSSIGGSFKELGINFIKAESLNDDGGFIKERFAYIDNETNIKLKRSIIEENDILFSIVGVIGRVAIANKSVVPANTNQNISVIKPNNTLVYPDFLKYSLISGSFQNQIRTKTIQTAQASVNLESLCNSSVFLPPLEEQKQIAALFQSIETAMEQVDGQEKNLLQLKNKLLSELFSDKKEFGNHLTAKDFETVRFDRIAINISERVEPKKTELTTYVGLEHLDADNLVIERTGTPDEVIGTKLKIYKGDIIFGKRRAYLRKVAVSHFDGIASAHSMILRANEKHIEKDFLPYFMQSDAFMSRAVQISEGSLSPTIKVKALAQQEFTLPKKEMQKELVALFKQFDETRKQLKQQKATLKLLKQKLLNEILG
jgi:type I restriction enzyme S subunit